ncbi:hypothetical protein [Flavobacterium sp. GCM10023249]|uniref:hypothetical protein n=1 Tax=unclassified Flavobacterium TaxID=196869 RepID=UPI00360915E7
MRVLFFLCAVFGLISCGKKVGESSDKPYVISEERRKYEMQDELYEKGEIDKIVLMNLPKYFYGSENFILDDSSNVFYYHFQPKIYESCIPFEDDDIPYFQGLEPDLLIQLPKESLAAFVKLNFRRGIKNKVKIASQKDTLNSKAYFKIRHALDKYLSFRPDNDIYLVYPTTQEEDSVLYYKKHQKVYNPDSIKWDKKRIRFFTKVKIEE